MGKRKANIFTVVESVNNWFDASNHDLTIPEGSAELGNQSGINEEIALQTKGTEAADTCPRLIVVIVDVGSGTPAAEVAPPGVFDFKGGTTDPLCSEVDGSASSAHNALWRLLQTAGYECW